MKYLEAMQDFRRIHLPWQVKIHERDGVPDYPGRREYWDIYLGRLVQQERITDWDRVMFPYPACCGSQTIVRKQSK